jgi:hypothetical protein
MEIVLFTLKLFTMEILNTNILGVLLLYFFNQLLVQDF